MPNATPWRYPSQSVARFEIRQAQLDPLGPTWGNEYEFVTASGTIVFRVFRNWLQKCADQLNVLGPGTSYDIFNFHDGKQYTIKYSAHDWICMLNDLGAPLFYFQTSDFNLAK